MKFHRHSLRLPDYNYTSQGLYYVTICTQNRELFFENNNVKQMIDNRWQELKNKFPDIDLDKYVIMPNHLHGIIVINNTNRCRGEVSSPYINKLTSNNIKGGETTIDNFEGGETSPLQQREKYALGQIIGYFKYQSTKEINKFLKNEPGQKLWQRNYFEHIIRNEQSLNKIRQYIKNNPSNWETDRNNPKNWKRY